MHAHCIVVSLHTIRKRHRPRRRIRPAALEHLAAAAAGRPLSRCAAVPATDWRTHATAGSRTPNNCLLRPPPAAAAAHGRWPAEANTALPRRAPERMHCSAAHSASFGSPRITCRRSSRTPAACQAGAYGRQGGSINTTCASSVLTWANSGHSSSSSPMPSQGTSTSLRPAAIQPCPGSTASSAARPVVMPSRAARQRRAAPPDRAVTHQRIERMHLAHHAVSGESGGMGVLKIPWR